MMRYFLMLTTLLAASIVQAGSVSPRAGWLVHETEHAYADLIPKVRSAVKQNGMFVVTQAGPTGAAKKRGITIPGNRVIGIYNNDFAVRAIRLSVPAMIEAPIRLYVTEDEGGTATLSYKMPSHVFAPYFDEGGPELRALAAELDAIFASIATDAIGE